MNIKSNARLPWLVVVVMGAIVTACSPRATPGSPVAGVPMQTGTQTTLAYAAQSVSSLGFDAKGVLYLGGAGVATQPPGATNITPLQLEGSPTVATMAVAPDGRLYLVTLDGVVEAFAPGGTTPQRLPFGALKQFSDVVVAKDGTVYLGDDQHDKLLKLAPGASAPTELPVSGVDGPGHMAIDADDNLYVTMMGKVVKIAKDATAAEPVPGASSHVGGLAVDTEGNLYATDVETNTVSRRPASGGDWVPLPFVGLRSPTHVAVGPDGSVVVVSQGRQVVRLAAK